MELNPSKGIPTDLIPKCLLNKSTLTNPEGHC